MHIQGILTVKDDLFHTWKTDMPQLSHYIVAIGLLGYRYTSNLTLYVTMFVQPSVIYPLHTNFTFQTDYSSTYLGTSFYYPNSLGCSTFSTTPFQHSNFLNGWPIIVAIMNRVMHGKDLQRLLLLFYLKIF